MQALASRLGLGGQGKLASKHVRNWGSTGSEERRRISHEVLMLRLAHVVPETNQQNLEGLKTFKV